MISIVLAGLLHLQPAKVPKDQIPVAKEIYIPPSDDTLNVMFVADKGNRIYKILTLPQFQKEMNKCIMYRVDGYDSPVGPVMVFHCEEQ